MKLNNNYNSSNITPLDCLEKWMETFRGIDGYYGPVVGLRGTSTTWCGPAHDWRWEGLFNGWVSRHRKSDNPEFIDNICRAMNNLKTAQLPDGSFRNSCFEQNPHEGGMPHEPAVITALLRAGKYLNEIGRTWPDGTAAMLEQFVEERLIKTLWNKTLQTFNNWMQSDFEVYSPAAVAAIIETLFEYSDISDTGKRWTPYITGAGESLLKSQIKTGSLAGALPVSSSADKSTSPFLSARCLPALLLMHQRTGDNRFANAAEHLADFVIHKFRKEGGLSYMAFADRPDRNTPLYIGAAAGALSALKKADRISKTLLEAQLDWLLSQQTESGGFNTAVGFGQGLPRKGSPDWRDVLPACGWSSMIYELLVSLATTLPHREKTENETVIQSVTVCGRKAEMTENRNSIIIKDRSMPLFTWHKRTIWPEVCLL